MIFVPSQILLEYFKSNRIMRHDLWYAWERREIVLFALTGMKYYFQDR